MLNILLNKKFPVALILLSIVINLAGSPFLPTHIAVHFNSSGAADGFIINKYAYILFMTLVSSVVYLIGKFIKRYTDDKILLISAVLFIINIGLLLYNIK